jgi:hypothetical protein
MRKVFAAVFGICLAATPAFAQDDRPVEVNFGFGWSFPSTDFKNSFDAGWTGTIGATFFFRPDLGVSGEYTYNRMGGPEKTIDVFPTPVDVVSSSGILESNHQIHSGVFNLVYRKRSEDRPIGGYVLGGGGVYHRIVQVTTPSVGYTSYCDPYWYVCYPTLVSVDTIIGDRSSTDFGIDIGGGVTFGRQAKFYIESRYTYVWGPEITPQAGTLPADADGTPSSYSSNASYFPLTFGFRF